MSKPGAGESSGHEPSESTGHEPSQSTGHEPLQQKARALFDDSVEGLDAETLSKLNQGRQRALAELGRPAMPGQWLRWIPATGVVAAALVTVIVVRGPGDGEPLAVPIDTAADFEILIGEDSLEMLEELEFYAWIEDADLEPGGNAG